MFDADIRWTTHGVAHIRAADWAGLGFGQGWACARDHLPTIADQIVKVRSERSLYLGPGHEGQHLASDFGYLVLGVADRAAALRDAQPPFIRDLVTGYTAGYNAWLAEAVAGDLLPEWCAGAAWVRPIDELDLYTYLGDVTLLGSGRNLVQIIGRAEAPGADGPHPPSPISALGGGEPGAASNGWAFGGDATASGHGLVVANPHFPWGGEARFWECHLTVPGELDVYGVSLVGAPAVHIGFNRDVAWTHTFSAGHRFVVYQLDLVPGEPTSYRYGDEVRSMTSRDVSVAVLGEDDAIGSVHRTLWSTHHGPMVDIPLLGWSETAGFALRDVNDGNDRFLGQYLAMDRATSVGDLRAAVHEHQGLPWVNVIAADRHGDVWYCDASPTPNLSDEVSHAFDRAVDEDPLTALFFSQRVALLNGSDPTTEWIDAGARQPGAVPPDRLPELTTDTVAFNSNDPYWVAHPELRVDRGPVLAGLYGRPLSPRTRMNATVLSGAAPTGPSGPEGRWTRDDLERALLDNRSLLAEQLLDGVVDRCRSAGVVERGSSAFDLGAIADLLAGWDRAFDLTSVGAVVWREFLGGFSNDDLRKAGPLYAEPFDPERATLTPSGLAPAPESGTDPIVTRMVDALVALDRAGVAYDAVLGDVQYVDRSGERIALHGANEVEGIINVVAPYGAFQRSDLEPEVPAGDPIPGRTEVTGLRVGGYPITYGASTLMVVGFDDDGPVGRGLLTYGQSGDAASEHHADQMREFSAKRLRPLRFDEDDIVADPEYWTMTLHG